MLKVFPFFVLQYNAMQERSKVLNYFSVPWSRFFKSQEAGQASFAANVYYKSLPNEWRKNEPFWNVLQEYWRRLSLRIYSQIFLWNFRC